MTHNISTTPGESPFHFAPLYMGENEKLSDLAETRDCVGRNCFMGVKGKKLKIQMFFASKGGKIKPQYGKLLCT